ncbi:MAG: mycofactocin biosynthesis glycosyltransferase MftF [Ilumatobacteraceae bacterium]
MAEARFVLDESYRRTGDGALIIGGSPLRLFRLTAAGQAVADALEGGRPLPANHRTLTDRLVDGGVIHPVAVPGVIAPRDVTVVVPAWRRVPVTTSVPGVRETVVVDDGSDPPLTVTDARLVRLPVNRGPGAARNAGLATVTTPFVAFVDADVELPAGWLDGLLGHLADDRVALVAPRVRTTPAASPNVDAIEAERGSLDLGPAPGRVATGSRVSYVPAAVLVCRVDALRAVGGFDETLRWGEDVDLVWRLAEAGWRCRYEPAVVVGHHARPTVAAWLRQQYEYGTSAAPLARRHPGALAPLRVSGWSVGAWALATITRRPIAGAALTVGTALALQRKLRGVSPADAARLAAAGTLAAGEQIANAVTRTWWPIAVALLPVRRLRPVVLTALATPPLLGAWRARSAHPARSVALRLAADLAYGAGVWRGALRERSAAALVPDLANWPPRQPAARRG